ncbi:1-acyl-sn-glycerol-3-phosphate acyltransferase [Nocardia cyriacigeorgica]|uniref:lysophospholipid acyltransferase family protein n=1 Tax=Nocardia cyriacigeorgica TaxID=135487 RepID=UPI001894F16F|nr:lysophospholipid acyltransferase family protein [Nocardia cyriacigeorgica]MBF6101763.1 1-acyl-sn-glycerol-3-phosphate acyltransferase [Nocardia cyriacigeorgica]
MVFDAPPATAAHSWMPISPCGPGCVQAADTAGSARVAGRAVRLAGLLASYPAAHVLTPARRREWLQREYARAVLRSCGIRLRVIDNRGTEGPARYAEPGAGVLVVAGHIGWSDVVVLAAVQPLGFVARADLIDWPMLGRLAELMRIIPIERERLRALPGVVAQIAERLAAGERVAAFPEGTTWCGRAYGKLRPALFQAAVDTGTPVQPIRLRYLDAHGEPCTATGFVGDDTFATSARRILRSRGIVAEVVLEPIQQPGTDRRELARRCEELMRAPELSDGARSALAAATSHLADAVARTEQGHAVTGV